MSELGEVRRAQHAARERMRGWGRGAGGRQGTPAPLHGAREGGAPQRSVTIEPRVGEHIVLPVTGIDDGFLQFGAPIGSQAGFLTVEDDGPVTGAAAYYDATIQLTSDVWDTGWLETWHGDSQVKERLVPMSPWGPLGLHATLRYGPVPRGEPLRIRMGHAGTVSGWVTFELKEQPADVTTEPVVPPTFFGEFFTSQGSHSLDIPEGAVQAGDLLLVWLWTSTTSASNTPVLDVPDGTLVDSGTFTGGLASTRARHSMFELVADGPLVTAGELDYDVTTGGGGSVDNHGRIEVAVLRGRSQVDDHDLSGVTSSGSAAVELEGALLTVALVSRSTAGGSATVPTVSPSRELLHEVVGLSAVRGRWWWSEGGAVTVEGTPRLSGWKVAVS